MNYENVITYELVPGLRGSHMKLDNAANIYPAIKSLRCTAMFRLSIKLTEAVDETVLESALQNTLRRLPSFSQRLRSGLFWHYFEGQDGCPPVQRDLGTPCGYLDPKHNDFLLRVWVNDSRISVEFFHALTDGTGGMMFLKTLVAEYLSLKYGASIPYNETVLSCKEPPKACELEDSFKKYAKPVRVSRRESTAYHVRGTREPVGVMHITKGLIPLDELSAKAKKHSATINEFLVAILISSIRSIQLEEKNAARRNLPVKVSIPINLRKFYGSKSLRNFTSYVNLGIEPILGEYSFDEIIAVIKHRMALEGNEKALNAKLSTNVASEKNPAMRAIPLFMKNSVLRLVYLLVGDRYNSATLSNLGLVTLPEEMSEYIDRVEFMLGPGQNPVACSCISFKNTLCFNFSRTIAESPIEREFFSRLVKMGIHVQIESGEE